MATSFKWLIAALLAPLAGVLLGMQIVLITAVWGVINLGVAGLTHSAASLDRGAHTLQTAADLGRLTWTSPAANLLELNPLTLGFVDDAGRMAEAVAVGAQSLTPLAQLGAIALGFDGEPKIMSGSTVNLEALPALEQPTADLNAALERTEQALSEVDGDGPLGRPVAAVARQWQRIVTPMAQITESLKLALPGMPEALGASEPKRYLVCALNDAEVFGSGGAPLAAAMVEVVKGQISVPVSGQMESKLSPNNPPIRWDYKGGRPWYRPDGQYPFVNSDFPPDFRSAAVDMRRAWAALGYPAVDGVITVDVTALSRILAWTGPIESPGYGQISAANIDRKVLVDAYRDYNSPEGVEVRHQMNTDLATNLARAILSPTELLNTVSGVMSSIPDRHIQANFAEPVIQAAVTNLGAAGRLANESGDLLGVFSQSGPNKLSVFQERRIEQDVVLTADGGARVTQTVQFTNAVPDDLDGDPNTYRGYTALRARIRVAYRIPAQARDWSLDLGGARALVRAQRVGPYPDGSGGKVLWQGQDIDRGATSRVVVTYRLPAGTWSGISGMPIYTLAADPQALSQPVKLKIRVSAAPGAPLPAAAAGWETSAGTLTWSGLLDRPLRLSLYSQT